MRPDSTDQLFTVIVCIQVRAGGRGSQGRGRMLYKIFYRTLINDSLIDFLVVEILFFLNTSRSFDFSVWFP